MLSSTTTARSLLVGMSMELRRLNHLNILSRDPIIVESLDIKVSPDSAETLLGLMSDKRTLRVEWYIVILIVIEIVLTLYELFFRHA